MERGKAKKIRKVLSRRSPIPVRVWLGAWRDVIVNIISDRIYMETLYSKFLILR